MLKYDLNLRMWAEECGDEGYGNWSHHFTLNFFLTEWNILYILYIPKNLHDKKQNKTKNNPSWQQEKRSFLKQIEEDSMLPADF